MKNNIYDNNIPSPPPPKKKKNYFIYLSISSFAVSIRMLRREYVAGARNSYSNFKRPRVKEFLCIYHSMDGSFKWS